MSRAPSSWTRRALLTLGAVVALAPACASTPAPAPVAPVRDAAAVRLGLTTVYVTDQARALAFYTTVLGFTVKDDVSNEGYRWLTVAAPDAPDHALQLARADLPAAKAYQEALYTSGQPALMLFTADLDAAHTRLAARGAKVTTPPTEVMPGVRIVVLDDGCGNLVQLSQIDP